MAKKGQPDHVYGPLPQGQTRKRGEKSLESNLKYDKKKRKRDFLDKWLEDFPGLM